MVGLPRCDDRTREPQWPGIHLSGNEGTITGCNLATPCTFNQVRSQLDDDPSSAGDAVIFNVAVGKGRDFAWSGAVDALRVSDTIYDFEPFGGFGARRSVARHSLTNGPRGPGLSRASLRPGAFRQIADMCS